MVQSLFLSLTHKFPLTKALWLHKDTCSWCVNTFSAKLLLVLFNMTKFYVKTVDKHLIFTVNGYIL